MCRFIVLDTCGAGRRLGLFDDYGKFHLARVTAGPRASVGDVLHGAHPAVGLHFLVAADSGQRLSTRIEFVGVSRQAMLDYLHAAPQRRPSKAPQGAVARLAIVRAA